MQRQIAQLISLQEEETADEEDAPVADSHVSEAAGAIEPIQPSVGV
jgi:hypothetical protein